ncbi:type II toxin-antitoxin system death-on-curing family toxin [Gordonia bronchialis]|uniref:type II toxin-antitoxin system death-on-curing family toxin n=1 Tax=Gordonia bronchialis TaxID=2054 RepID=UPI00226D7F09|nr:type II toxin-antitoxin system death-on-curing family toxin [Gordonia bronchialis]
MMARSTFTGDRVTLEYDDVMQIRTRLLSTHLGRRDFGVREPLDRGALESAVARQNTGYGADFKYNRPHEIAASLFYGIAMNHAFENGNKRTALVSALVALKFNDVVLTDTTQDDLYDMATQVVAHTFPVADDERTVDSEVAALAAWFRARTVRREPYVDRAIEFPDFRRLLQSQGCEFSTPKGNYVKITRNGRAVKAGYPREKHTVQVNQVKRIRSALGLDEIDSSEFYNVDVSVDDFVHQYSEVLERLADA